ncbi:anthocyanidin 3-O-glucosyltransferase-like [Panicum miliaceum]|uniref:Anthocyanidin 3-O-glucosyltransferase-like n=1 Tax=Panicum miliaceum TaxID=4540 RepID=A0A3L6SGQ5_PANMI|nr:anthocyanidin 3-O-glucosyltransferase-like [Panicum miliaceum]
MAGRGEGGAGSGVVHVVMFPWLAFGHISPFAQLARRLVSGEAGVRVTFLTAAGIAPRVEAMLASAAGAVRVLPLSLPQVPGLPTGAANTADVSADGAELLKLALDGTRPEVCALLAELRPDAVLIDFTTPWVCDVAAPLGAKVLYFSVFSAASFATVPAHLADWKRPSAHDLMVPPAGFPAASALASMPAHQRAVFLYMYTSFYDMPCAYDRLIATVKGSAGFVMKTCREMEGPYIDYISSQYGKPLHLAGPVVPEPPQGELEERWASWLSSFPDDSVIFASFGSETFLPVAAATELLLGLEATNRPFLVVLNFPKGTDAAAEVEACTPPGFEERVKGRGLVHTGWVQQQHILRHRSVGCFVNHAGFSSVVEGLVAGCRLVLLPMKTDQYFNAALFARDLRVGVEVARRDEDGWFGRGDVTDAVAASVATGGDGDASKWREFFTNEAVQNKFEVDFVRELKKVVRA